MADHTDAGPLSAAVHESVVGTKRTWCDVRSESALRGKAEVGFRGRQVGFWTQLRHQA